MTSSTLPAPLTVRAFLFGDGTGADTAEAVGRAFREQGVAEAALRGVRHLSAAGAQLVDREVGKVVDNLLAFDLGDVLVSCWRKHRALTEAARRTLATPDSEEVVTLAAHQATATYCPYVDLFVDDVKVTTLEFKLAVTFLATGLAAVVRSGELVALEGGDCLATATLTLNEAKLAERRMQFEPALMVNLRRGIRLVDETANRARVLPEQRPGSSDRPVDARNPHDGRAGTVTGTGHEVR